MNGEGYVQDDLLEGHTIVARELVGYLTPEKSFNLDAMALAVNHL